MEQEREPMEEEPSSSTQEVDPCPLPAKDFPSRRKEQREWFARLSSGEKDAVLRDVLEACGPPQIHALSSLLEPRLHEDCPPNCQDPMAYLPINIALRILSYLEPEDLSHCSRVCLRWRKLTSASSLWRRLCSLPHRFRRGSRAAEIRHLQACTQPDGFVKWREAFVERYRLWQNWAGGRCVVRTFAGHTGGLSCVQLDSERIVSGSFDSTIRVWDIRTNSTLATLTLTGHSDTVHALHLDYPVLASGSNDTTVKAWSSVTCRVTMVGHGAKVRCLQMDRQKLISGSYDWSLRLWDMGSGACTRVLSGHDDAVLCLQYDDAVLVSGSADNSIKIWDARSAFACVMSLQNAHSDSVTCLQFDEANRIISGSLDSSIKFWDLRTGRWISSLEGGHSGVVRCLQADGVRIVSGADDKNIQVWNVSTGRKEATLRGHSDGVTCLRFDDTKILSGSFDRTVKLWDFGIG